MNVGMNDWGDWTGAMANEYERRAREGNAHRCYQNPSRRARGAIRGLGSFAKHARAHAA
jgi:hypothetical protein